LKKIAVLILTIYYAFGIFCLPMSNFSALKDLPQMYQHCKATEDKDMAPFDFLTDHLINIDGIFDKHDNGDTQKPHNPSPAHSQQLQVFCLLTFSYFNFTKAAGQGKLIIKYAGDCYHSDFISGFFRSPIV
jgi:hypothetical protein